MAARVADSAAKIADSIVTSVTESLTRQGIDISKMGADRRQLGADRSRGMHDSIQSAMQELRDALRGLHGGTQGDGHGPRQIRVKGSGDTVNVIVLGDSHTRHRGSLANLIDRVRHDPDAIALPAADSFVTGGLTIAAGTHRLGTAATVDGDLDVFGMVDGDAVAVGGDVVLHPGSHVTGSAFAAGGQVRLEGGAVDGEIRSIEGPIGGPVVAAGGKAPVSSRPSRMHDFRVAFGMLCLLMLLGIVVLTLAEDQLDQVTATLADRFGKAAWYGIVGEIAVLPGFLALVVGLAITLIGILAIPFATAGYFILLAGASTLGFVAVAQATGTAVLPRQAALTPRGAQLRAVVTGTAIYGVLWMLTAMLGDGSAIGMTVRGVVVVVTVVAVTVGFGAVLLWRFELRRARRQRLAAPATPADPAMWVTPTPVTGVAAARRPTPPAGPPPVSST
jgi:hypothetical protein